MSNDLPKKSSRSARKSTSNLAKTRVAPHVNTPKGKSPEELEATQLANDDTAGMTQDSNQGQTGGSKYAAEEEDLPIFSNYEVIKVLGMGGMGAVYLARQKNLDRMCALKIMKKDIAKNEQFVARFLREARSMAKIDHPNLVRCYDVGEENGIHFLAMELIDGQSMQDWLDQLKMLEVGDALHVVILAAEALKCAHELNMIHRDIKPDNILVTSKGEVKVADLGLAKNTEEDLSMTQSGTGLGTPHYMAPEQARNAKHVDGKSDIYALGCTIYHFLSGQRPFKANSTLELIMEKEKGKYPPIRQFNKKVPEKLELIIDKMLMKDPNHRYKSCEDLLADLEKLGLTAPSLSFIKSEKKASLRSGASSSVSSSGSTTRSGTRRRTNRGAPLTSQQDAMNQKQTAVADKVWYIKQPKESGEVINAKLKTDKVLECLKTGKINLKAQVAASKKGPYLPISQIPVFDEVCQKLLVKTKAEARGEGLKNTFAKLDQQHRWRKVWQFFDGIKRNILGGLSLIIWLAAIAAVCLGVWSYRTPILNYLKAETGITIPGLEPETTPENSGVQPPQNAPQGNTP